MPCCTTRLFHEGCCRGITWANPTLALLCWAARHRVPDRIYLWDIHLLNKMLLQRGKWIKIPARVRAGMRPTELWCCMGLVPTSPSPEHSQATEADPRKPGGDCRAPCQLSFSSLPLWDRLRLTAWTTGVYVLHKSILCSLMRRGNLWLYIKMPDLSKFCSVLGLSATLWQQVPQVNYMLCKNVLIHFKSIAF